MEQGSLLFGNIDETDKSDAFLWFFNVAHRFVQENEFFGRELLELRDAAGHELH